MDRAVDRWIDEHKNELIDALSANLKIASLKDTDAAAEGAPFGPMIRRALDTALDCGRSLGFETVDYDGYCGAIDMPAGEEQLGIICHLDVVPEGSGWTYPPYGAEIHDGKLYARGTMDDKGPAYAALFAMKAVKECKIPLKRSVRLILGCDEESGMSCLKHYNRVAKAPTLSFSPDAEYPVVNSEKMIFRTEYKKEFKSGITIKAGTRRNVVPGEAVATVPMALSRIVPIMEAFMEGSEFACSAEAIDENSTRIIMKGLAAHASAPRKAHNLIKLKAHQQHGLVLVALIHYVLVYILNRTNVKPARGVNGYKKILVVRDFSCDYDLLLVAAGKIARVFMLAASWAYVIFFYKLRGMLVYSLLVDNAVRGEGLFAYVLQQQIILNRKIKHKAVLMPVRRYAGYAHVKQLPRRFVVCVVAVHGYGAGGRFFKARKYLDKLGLAVAVYTGYADYLALADLEIEAAQHLNIPVIPGVQVVYLKRDVSALYIGLVHLEFHVAADHHGGELLLRRVRNLYGVYIFALPDYRAVIGSLLYLLKLVGYKYYALALARKVMHYLNKLLNLLRSKRRGGLVKYKYICAAIQHLKYFRTLLHAHGYVLYFSVGIYVKAVTFGYLVHLFARCLHVDHAQRQHRLQAQNDVFRYRERLHQHKVLMHHAYAKLYGFVWP